MRALATLRSHAVTVLVTIGAVVAVVVATVVAAGSGPPSVAFREPGHWVYNRIERAAFHVDAGTRRVDARVDVPSSAGDPLMVLQGHREGYVVARDAVSPFARAALTVGAPAPAARDEVPIGVEVVGGPYLVYPQAGTIVRLGEPRTSVEVGGPVGTPVRGADGTVWVHRPDTGEVCALRGGAVTLDCTARTTPSAAGALVVVAGRPAWLDPAAGTLADLMEGSSTPIDLGERGGPVLVGEAEVAGRLPVVVPDRNALVLADVAGGAPAVVDLGPGRWSPPAAGNAVAVLDQDGGRLRTFDAGGAPLGTAELAPGATGPVPGADGRLYVDDPQGTATAVVAPDGSVTTVPTGGVTPGTVARAAAAVRAAAPAGSMQRDDDRAVAVPRPPTGVAVKRQGDVLTVSWRAPAGAVDHYTVVLNRAVATTTTATSATLRSPAGRPVRVAVSATNTAGTGPLSTVVTAAAAVARPGAPVALTLAAGDRPQPYAFAPSWKAPDLGGGALIRYEVSWTSATGAKTTKTTTGTSLPPVAGDPCAAPYTVAVRAVTRTPAGRLLTGPPATSSAPAPPAGSCAVRMTLDASADGDDAMTVTATDDGGATGPCVLSVDGTVRWSGTCGDRARTRIAVGGLDPGTTYTVVLTARNPDGSTTRTDPVSVTTD